jgi:hypothetical protein
MSTVGFHHLIQRLGKAAKMPFPLHPHMLRHACGCKLANDGHDTRALQHYLGHKNIQHIVPIHLPPLPPQTPPFPESATYLRPLPQMPLFFSFPGSIGLHLFRGCEAFV